MVAEGITIKYSMINMDKITDAPTAIAPTDIIYGTQISNVLKGEILQAYIIYIYMCLCVYVCICIYEQKFILAEIMRMRMFKMLLTSV